MFLKSREIAFLGIMMAFSVLLVTLGGYLDISTIFFLAAASFLVGMIERNFSCMIAVFFLAGSLLLNFFLAPQKLYAATFGAFSVYVIVAEHFEKKRYQQEKGGSPFKEWIVKGVLYHILLAAAFFCVKEIFGFGEMTENKLIAAVMEHKMILIPAAILMAEAFWLVFDRAYVFFARQYGRFFFMDRYL